MAVESRDTRLLPEVARPWVDAFGACFGPRVESRLIGAAQPLVDQCTACGGPAGAGAAWSPAPSPCWTNTGAMTEWLGTARGVTPRGRPRVSGKRAGEQSRIRLSSDNSARVGPTTPTRAGRLADASVDPTDARKALATPDRRPVDGLGPQQFGEGPGLFAGKCGAYSASPRSNSTRSWSSSATTPPAAA